MPFRKEGADVILIPEGIEDKYEIVKILQETAATAVLLVNYKKIGALRILKAVHRAHPNANSILSEAHLLQGIKSSQTPTIFNVEETKEMYYLVEEFVEGLSLREYLLDNILSKEELLRLALSLCEVVETLHNMQQGPVLYRDMKPEHVIIQDDTVKLIDFGISIYKSEAAKAMPLGTKNWAAPEQMKGENLDERCDVYGVGKIIEFMQINSYAKDDFRIKKLVSHATQENVEERLRSIADLKKNLYDILGVKTNEKSDKGYLGKKIAVVGNSHAVGTTTIAIKLCRFLNQKGIKSYYKDVEGDTVHILMENLKGTYIKDGVLYHKNFSGILNYGEAIEKPTPPKGIYIIDCKDNTEEAMNCDLILFIVNTAPWHKQQYPQWIKDDSVYIISNLSNKLDCIAFAKKYKKKVFMYPQLKSVIRLEKEEERIFSTILQNEMD